MKKLASYWLVAKNTWDEALTYRLNFAVWRLRVFLSLISSYFLWFTLLPKGSTIGDYNQATMLTYILGSAILYAVVMATRTASVADDIIQGSLSNYLIKPVNYIGYYFSKDIGDKAMNIAFSIVEVSILFILFRPPFFFQTNIFYILSFLLSVCFAISINFSINMMLSFIGFFSPEAWAPRFIFFILVTFLAGITFPLDILPKPLFWLFVVLPFPSLLYAPMKIYLGNLSFLQVGLYLSIGFLWSLVLGLLVYVLWKRGLKHYGAEGH